MSLYEYFSFNKKDFTQHIKINNRKEFHLCLPFEGLFDRDYIEKWGSAFVRENKEIFIFQMK